MPPHHGLHAECGFELDLGHLEFALGIGLQPRQVAAVHRLDLGGREKDLINGKLLSLRAELVAPKMTSVNRLELGHGVLVEF